VAKVLSPPGELSFPLPLSRGDFFFSHTNPLWFLKTVFISAGDAPMFAIGRHVFVLDVGPSLFAGRPSAH